MDNKDVTLCVDCKIAKRTNGLYCRDCAIAWIRSPEGVKAMQDARDNAKKAIDSLKNPERYRKTIAKCTCCPIHGKEKKNEI